MPTKLGSNNPFPKVILIEQSSTPSAPSAGEQKVYIRTSDHHLVRENSGGAVTDIETSGGDVVGPASAVDVRIAVFDGTTGKLIKDGGKTIAEILGGSGQTIQTVFTETGAAATGTTSIPFDDTIPQSTEGDEYMTRAITPTSASNKLRIDVVVPCSCSQEQWLIAALFQDSGSDALAAAWQYMTTASSGATITFSHLMTAGTTSATTFKVRAGRNAAGTFTFNGSGGARKLGGVLAASITITEYVP